VTFAQRRNRLTTHFSGRIPVVWQRISVCVYMYMHIYTFYTQGRLAAVAGNIRQSD